MLALTNFVIFISVVASFVAGEIPNNIQALCMWSPAAVVTDEINIDTTI
ncbi:hypothetical protein ACFQZ1_10770 [Bacillus sp. CGMCC 1.60114]